ncbi:unnamed protein product, partial [Heterosigma akashiwo]
AGGGAGAPGAGAGGAGRAAPGGRAPERIGKAAKVWRYRSQPRDLQWIWKICSIVACSGSSMKQRIDYANNFIITQLSRELLLSRRWNDNGQKNALQEESW